jgi:tetratricopeptide (TPR) repeat protein
MQAYEKSTPYHFVQHDQRGKWLLAAARRVKSPEYLAEAAAAYEAAARCYPNSAYQHAQLAFVYHELGRKADAEREADTAAKLDALCPHIEQKLENRKLYDSRWDGTTRTMKTDQSPNAAEFVNKLRPRASSTAKQD